MLWTNLRADEFPAAIERSKGLCVVPIGCLEKHGPHMPVGTDYIIAMDIIQEAARQEDVVIFETGPWLGDVVGNHSMGPLNGTGMSGYIALKPELIMPILENLCDEIARNGFRKILLVNQHGGNNSVLGYFLRAQGYETKGYVTLSIGATDKNRCAPGKFYPWVLEHREDFPELTEEDMAFIEKFGQPGIVDGHAGYRETAMVMAYHPELIAEDRMELESGLSTHRADYLTQAGINFGQGWDKNYPNAYCGTAPVGINQRISKAIARLSVERMVNVFKLLKKDEDCVRMANRLPKLDD